MKKLTLPYLLLLMPFFALSQRKPPILKNVWKRVPGITSAFKFNDHLGIMQVTLTDTSFELMALDNKMGVLWQDTLEGCGVACGKFKGNILAVADSGFSRKGNINPYYAYLVDSSSGKIILQKKIFSQKAPHYENATAFFAADGGDFNLVVRQAEIRTGFFSAFKNKTEDLTLISLNEKLEPTYIKPKIPDEAFVGLAMNQSGDFFLMTTRDEKSLDIRRYAHGSAEPSEPITQPCDSLDKTDLLAADNAMVPSDADRNIVYLSIAHTNLNDDREVITAKFNFATHQSQSTSEVFNHKHIRAIKKSFVPVNNDFREANLGLAKQQLRVKYLAAHDGRLLTVSSEEYSVMADNAITWYGNALVITYYDSNLKTLFQQVMPVKYISGWPLTTGYSFGTNDLKIVSNTFLWPAYGQLDLSSGKWLKLAPLNHDHGSDKHIIWFDNNLIVPLLHRRAFGLNYNISLSLNSYK